jgi:hypothetical protein
VGEHLVVEAAAGRHTRPGRRGRPGGDPGRRGRRVPVAAAVAAAASAVLVTGAVVAPVRAAVADWFGIGSTRIERVPPDREDAADPTGLPPVDAGVRPVSRAAAEHELGRPLPRLRHPALGEPDLVAVAPEGGVLLGWDRAATTLWILPTDDPADRRMSKVLDDHDTAEPVAGLGEGAVIVEGDHVLATPDRRVAAGTVVLWIEGGFEYRLESDLGRTALLAAARSLEPG